MTNENSVVMVALASYPPWTIGASKRVPMTPGTLVSRGMTRRNFSPEAVHKIFVAGVIAPAELSKIQKVDEKWWQSEKHMHPDA